MNIKYNKQTDLMYIHFTSEHSSVLVKTDSNDISKFVSKNDYNYILGYEIEETSKNIIKFLDQYPLNRKQKLAIVMAYLRYKKDKTEKEFSVIINVSEESYKDIEKANHNIGFETIDRILNVFKNEPEINVIFKG